MFRQVWEGVVAGLVSIWAETMFRVEARSGTVAAIYFSAVKGLFACGFSGEELSRLARRNTFFYLMSYRYLVKIGLWKDRWKWLFPRTLERVRQICARRVQPRRPNVIMLHHVVGYLIIARAVATALRPLTTQTLIVSSSSFGDQGGADAHVIDASARTAGLKILRCLLANGCVIVLPDVPIRSDRKRRLRLPPPYQAIHVPSGIVDLIRRTRANTVLIDHRWTRRGFRVDGVVADTARIADWVCDQTWSTISRRPEQWLQWGAARDLSPHRVRFPESVEWVGKKEKFRYSTDTNMVQKIPFVQA